MVSDGFDDDLSRARRELQELAAASEAEGRLPQGHGEAAEGLVRVTVEAGRISTVELNPRAMRLPSPDLAEAFTEATNAALADLESRYPPVALPSIDPATLDAQLAEVQQQGLIQMRRYNESLNDALRHLT
jgi:DNA-binding protein YbaB